MTNEQRELVERLRNRHLLGDCVEAATTIEQLAERCGRLEAALRAVMTLLSDGGCDCIYSDEDNPRQCPCKMARAALAGSTADRGGEHGT
jgi:hypothetical protein